MPDISMCLNKECPSKDQCYRFTAKTEHQYQWYAEFIPDETGKCGNYIDNNSDSKPNERNEPAC